ncbi:MAG: Gfo/Idh/MocA family oxidoreductase [Terracidiphilus sp.]
MEICIIGAGRMGNLRAQSASGHPRCRVTHIVDTDGQSAKQLARKLNCAWGVDWESAISRSDVDAVVVATSHRFLAPISIAAAKLGKHVFCEKPMACKAREAEPLIDAMKVVRGDGSNPKVVAGYTLRHHPGVAKAHRMLKEGAIGQPYYIRAHYGHGGRPGYDREWRSSKELGGGGELLDQGVHLIDLSRWFLGDFTTVKGGIETYFWTGTSDSDAPVKHSFAAGVDTVEDNAFVLLRTSIGQSALLHASWTQWKNSFLFEVFGRDGALSVSGLGGSYGAETLTYARRRPAGGAPEITEVPFCDVGNVWDSEWGAFVEAIAPSPCPAADFSEPASATDGLQVLRIVDRLYDYAQGLER